MSRRCKLCGKKAQTGNSLTRRGLPKKKGGVGLKTTGINKRRFLPNLQPKRVLINGRIKKILVCTKCLKKGKLILAPRKPQVSNN